MMAADEFIARHRSELEKNNGWELRFVEDVLRRVGALDFRYVDAQTAFVDRSGGHRRIDFTITEPHGTRVALEVDGWNKNGGDGGMTSKEFAAWSRREQDIVAQGWRLLRFANTEVRDNPQHCIASIERTLEIERAVAADYSHLAEALRRAEARAIQAETRFAETVVEADGHASRPDLPRDLVRARENRDRDRAAFDKLSAEVEAEVLPAVRVAHLARMPRPRWADPDEEHLFGTALSRAAHLEKENKNMKTLVVSLAAIAVSIAAVFGILAVAGVFGGSDEGSSVASPRPAAALTGSPSCDAAVPWQRARSLNGKSGTVVGPILSGTYREQTQGKPTFLNMGAPFGDDRGFTVVIFGANRSKFGGSPESDYDEQTIAATGQITEFDGRPQVIVNTPSAIERCDG